MDVPPPSSTPPSPPPAEAVIDPVQGVLPPVAHLERKAGALLLLALALVVGATLYLLQARGVFEPTQALVLTTDDSEGVVVGMDVTFSGFPIGRVRRIELAQDGNVRILVDVPRKDAHWLRESSVFTLVKGIVGGTHIRAYSGILTDPPLPDGAERPVLRGDATSEIPQIVASAKQLLENLERLTAQDGPLGESLAQVRGVTQRLEGPYGALGVLLGEEANVKQALQTLERTNALLARMDRLVARADRQVFGDQDSVVRDVRTTVQQLNGLLADTRATLRKVDAVLVEVQGIGSNVRSGTENLDALRTEVERNLRRIESMVQELQSRWPFAQDKEWKLP